MQPRTTALLLLATAVLGRGVIQWLARPGEAPGAVAFRVADPRGLARQRAQSAGAGAELKAGETVDVDRAGAGELARLPGVGAAMARRIVAERDRNGPYGGIPCLDRRVAGIGEGWIRRAGPFLAFSGASCAAEAPSGEGSAGAGKCPETVLLNEADERQLECLPGIGPSRAKAIIAWREGHGGFREVADLGRVPGVPKSVVERLGTAVGTGPMP